MKYTHETLSRLAGTFINTHNAMSQKMLETEIYGDIS
jgi:hypothetical protein